MTDEITIQTGWTADKQYSINFSTINRLITGLYGAIAPFEDVVHSDSNMGSHYLGQISKEYYDNIAESIINPGQLVFWTAENKIKLRKAVVDFGPNTYIDNTRNAIVGIDNLITLIPRIVDEHGKNWSDVTEIQIKNMGKLDFPININGGDPATYKASAPNGSTVTFQLGKRGRATLRVKAMVPEVDHVWISLYPELYGYDDDQLAKLAAWHATK